MNLAAEILDFWFGPEKDQSVPGQKLRLWFGGDAATDAMIRDRFAAGVEHALDGGYGEWTKDAEGTLALILLLDQFPRNIFRDTPRAYAGDPRARALTMEWVQKGRESTLPVVWRAFYYMPLEHAEDLDIQNLSVRSFEKLAATAPDFLTGVCESFLDYAIRHRDIIERFGRFPHRNRTLGRISSAAEEAFLQQPGYSF